MEEGADFRAALDTSCFLGAVPICERFIDSIDRGIVKIMWSDCVRDYEDAFDLLWRRAASWRQGADHVRVFQTSSSLSLQRFVHLNRHVVFGNSFSFYNSMYWRQ